MLREDLTNTLKFKEHASTDISYMDTYIVLKTILGVYNRKDCPLDDLDRELVIKHFIHGYSQHELAKQYNLSRQATGKRIDKAVIELERVYE